MLPGTSFRKTFPVSLAAFGGASEMKCDGAFRNPGSTRIAVAPNIDLRPLAGALALPGKLR